MMTKWNRETFLVTLTLVAVLVAVFYYGNQILIEPVKGRADSLTLLVDQQESVLADYPPSETLLSDFETDYQLTEGYLPIGDEASSAMVKLEDLALKEGVVLVSVSRMNDRQAVEELPESFLKNTYQAEITSDSPENMRGLIRQLMNEERVWNITSFQYDKNGETEYSGAFTFELYYYSDSDS